MQPRGVERARAHRAAVAAALAMTRSRGSEVVIVPRRHVGIVLAAVGRSQRSIAAAAVPPLLSLRATPRARPLSLRRTARSLHANARATPRMSGKMRWGDSADLDGSDDDFDVALPASQARALRRAARRSFARTRSRAAVHPSRLPSLMNRALRRLSLLRARESSSVRPQVFGPDANGVKTIIDYRIKEDGLKVRVVASRPQP